jgi:hypothetical protein
MIIPTENVVKLREIKNMQMSPEINELAEALGKAQIQFKVAKRCSENPFFKSSYADLASVYEAVREGLAANGLAISQWPTGGGVETILMHRSGQWIRDFCGMPAKDQSPQAIGSAITYARRYSLMAILGIPAEDDDGEGAEGRPSATPQKETVPAVPKVPTGETGSKEYTISEKQQKLLFARAKAAGINDFSMIRKHCQTCWGIESTSELTKNKLDDLLGKIEDGYFTTRGAEEPPPFEP